MSVRGDRYDEPRRSYTTVKRYQVPEQRSYEEDPVIHDKMIIRRERREDPPQAPRTEIDYRVTERDSRDYQRRDQGDWHVTERITERAPERRDISYRVIERDSDFDRRAGPRSSFHFSERDREVARAPSPPSQDRVREYRFERERDYSPQRSHYHHHHHEPEVERYSRETEYYQQPQPIIIREAAPAAPIIIREERRDPPPIIIREERREPAYEFVEREEVRDERQSLVRREEPPPPAPAQAPSVHSKALSTVRKPEDESYFYERRIREIDRGPRQEYRDDVRPRDSASQYGSDDSYEYVRREKITEEDGKRSSHSPHHRRHLAEGALAGVAGAELLRNHRKKEGRDVGGRGRSAIGGAAVGALGAEALSRARSFRRGSRSRSRSSSYDSRSRRKQKSKRSRSRSKSRVRQLGGLAAVAAVGALAGYALKNRGKNNETIIVNDAPPRRSRSRRRRASVDTGYLSGRAGSRDARDPEHRNRRIAQAGLASAAAAGIWERVRSKSRGGKSRERSKSKVRQGVPIAAAGLGGAALAGLYEKNKAGKEAKKQAIIDDELDRGRGRHSRSRSRSRSVPAPSYPVPGGRRRVDDRDMIAYGDDPIYPEPARGYYSDEEPGSYRRRHARSNSTGSSPDTRHGRRSSRSRSRGRNLAGAGLAAGAAGVAAHELGKRRERRRSESRRGRDDDEYTESYAPSEYDRDHPSGYITPPAHEPATYNRHPDTVPQAYPGGNYFPPPPHADPAYTAPIEAARDPAQDYNPYPAYNPADFPPGPTNHQPYEQTRGIYGDSDATLGAPYPNDTFAGDSRYAQPTSEDVAAARERDHEMRENEREGRRGRDPGNVSASDDFERGRRSGESGGSGGVGDVGESRDADGLKTPRPRSTSRVRFDLGSNVAFSPEQRRRELSHNSSQRPSRSRSRSRERERSDNISPGNVGTDGAAEPHRRRRHRHHRRDDNGDRDRERGQGRDRNRDGYSDTEDSEGTVELPPRFDEQGNRKEEGGGGDLGELLHGMLAGRGTAGKLFKGILGGEVGRDRDRGEGDEGGRRRRR